MSDNPSRLADIDTLTSGVKWRWGMVCVGGVILSVGHSLGIAELPPLVIVIFVTVGGIANLILIRLLQREWYRWWLVYVCCLLDVSLVALAITYLGPGGTIAGFLFVILPCAARPNRTLGFFALLSAAAAFLIAASLHGVLSESVDGSLLGLRSTDILDLILFVAVATPLLVTHSELFGRIADVHAVVSQVANGSLERRAPATRNDCLGHLEQSLNTMLAQVTSTIEIVQQGAEEIVDLAGIFARSSSTALESSLQLRSTASDVTRELAELQAAAEAGYTESTDVAQHARSLQSRAENDAGNTRQLEESLLLGRDQFARTSDAVSAIGADITRAAGLINDLSGLSRQIGSSALSIAKVARHTHVLALNAAIEAARAEEHGREFAVVADQVRTLAGEAGRSAREVGDLVSEVQAGITTAGDVMVAGEARINDITLIAGEARSALNDLRVGASNAAELVVATAEASRSQAKRAGSLADKMSLFASMAARLSVEVTEAISSISAQMAVMNDVDQANQQLADLAERLQKSVVRYSESGTGRTSES
jgi:methyl-accepting chemotaxis protein